MFGSSGSAIGGVLIGSLLPPLIAVVALLAWDSGRRQRSWHWQRVAFVTGLYVLNVGFLITRSGVSLLCFAAMVGVAFQLRRYERAHAAPAKP